MTRAHTVAHRQPSGVGGGLCQCSLLQIPLFKLSVIRSTLWTLRKNFPLQVMYAFQSPPFFSGSFLGFLVKKLKKVWNKTQEQVILRCMETRIWTHRYTLVYHSCAHPGAHWHASGVQTQLHTNMPQVCTHRCTLVHHQWKTSFH